MHKMNEMNNSNHKMAQNECINPIKSKNKQYSHDNGCKKWLAIALI
jgi:hypothetical protein